MKKQFLKLASVAVVVFLTSCKTSTPAVNSTESTANKASTAKSSKPERGQRPNMEERFAQMDANNDGKLSASEVKGPMKENFSKVDTDGNGYISKEELKNAPKPQGRPRKS